MKPHELDALVCDVLEGTASPAAKRELESWFATHPEDRERFERLREVFASLSRVPKVDAPADLSETVLAAIRAGETSRPAAVPTAAAPRGRHESPIVLRPRRDPRRLIEFAMPFAAGLAAGLLIVAGWVGGMAPRIANRNEVAGSMVPPGESRDWRLALGDAQVEPRVWSRPGSSSVKLRVRNARSLAVEVRYDARSRRVARVDTDLTSGAWQLASGRLRWIPASGDELTIEFAEPGPASALQLVLESPDGRREELLVPPGAAGR